MKPVLGRTALVRYRNVIMPAIIVAVNEDETINVVAFLDGTKKATPVGVEHVATHCESLSFDTEYGTTGELSEGKWINLEDYQVRQNIENIEISEDREEETKISEDEETKRILAGLPKDTE